MLNDDPSQTSPSITRLDSREISFHMELCGEVLPFNLSSTFTSVCSSNFIGLCDLSTIGQWCLANMPSTVTDLVSPETLSTNWDGSETQESFAALS